MAEKRKLRHSLLITAAELLVLALTVFFVYTVYSSAERVSPASSVDVAAAVVGQGLEAPDRMIAATGQEFRKAFGMDEAACDGVFYYRPASGMDASEILIARVPDRGDREKLLEAVKARVADRSQAFEGYAPDQCALLREHEPVIVDGFVFYAAGRDSAARYDAFYKAVRS